MMSIPDGATPADLFGKTDVLAGQATLNRQRISTFVELMKAGEFSWYKAQIQEPMTFQQGSNGLVIAQGHHRWVAARLAGITIPITIRLWRYWWPGEVPYAHSWQDVRWE